MADHDTGRDERPEPGTGTTQAPGPAGSRVEAPTEIHAGPGGGAPTAPLAAVDGPAPARRRGPDPLALFVGLATLAMAVFAFVGEVPDLSGVDPRWLLAAGAAATGLVLLVGSLRGRRGGG